MATKPVIFLSFANDDDAYLANLKTEEDQIYNSLQDSHDAGFIEIFNRGRTTIDDIFAQFTRYRDRIVIFHYGGHASGKQLRLEDRRADSSGLAKLMGQQKELQLVFLNGCSTQGQVDELLESGVKAVIATSTPISDRKAVDFSHQFYRSLAAKASIGEAFSEAVARLQTEGKLAQNPIKIFRSVSSKEMTQEEAEQLPAWDTRDLLIHLFDTDTNEPEIDEMPWGLYVKDEAVLNWKIPTVNKAIFSDPWVGTTIASEKVNQHIILPVFEAMAEFNPLFAEQLNFLKISQNPAMIDMLFRQMMDLIIKHFPWPIGIKLRTLFSSDDTMIRKTGARLDQMLETYTRLGKFLCYVLLAQLWDEITAKADFTLNPGYQEEVEELLDLTPETHNGFDFIRLMARITRIFHENDIQPFIEQFTNLFDSVEKQEGFYKAYKYLEEIRSQRFNGEINESELSEICDKTEFSLGMILKKSAFLVNYKLISIKDIGISKPRKQLPLFKHQMGVLAGVAIEVMQGTPKDYENFTDSHSVLVVKGIDKVDDYINLSPFVIDENAYKSINTPKIYMYAFHRDFESFFYEHVDNDNSRIPPEMLARENQNQVLVNQFNLFKKEILT